MSRSTATVCLILTGLLGLALTTSAISHDMESEATYTGNAGVLVEHGDIKILFDSFYSNSYNTYVLVNDSTMNDMLTATPPYDDVDAVFVSHVHGDHFSAAPMLAYLRAQPEVVLYASIQVHEALKAAASESDPVLDRVRTVSLSPGDSPLRFSHADLSIDVVAIPHSGGARMADIMNLAFRVNLGDSVVVMHMGDATVDRRSYEPLRTHFATPQIDTAFPPYWFVGDDDGEYILDEIIRPEQVIGVHVPSQAIGQGDRWRQRAGDDLFTDPGETRRLDKRPK